MAKAKAISAKERDDLWDEKVNLLKINKDEISKYQDMKKEYDVETRLHREAKENILDLEYDNARQRALNREHEARRKEHEAQAEELQRTIRDLSAKVSSARSCADAPARTKSSSESASGARSCADAGDDQ